MTALCPDSILSTELEKEVSCEFGQIKLFLQNEHEECLNEIHIEELLGLSELGGYPETLLDHVSTAKDLLKEVEAIHEGSDITFLTTYLSLFFLHSISYLSSRTLLCCRASCFSTCFTLQ